MIICIDQILTPEQLERIRNTLDGGEFQDGRSTAGWHAKLVKNNEQLKVSGGQAEGLRAEVEKALTEHPLFQMAVRPAKVTPLIFSRYRDGMTYGNHVDDPVMGRGAGRLRTDVSFTLFLDDPDSYDGGELVTETTAGEQSYKLPAGAAVVYPSSTLHRVDPVTRGQRRVAIGWAQSTIREPAQREVLFDLDTARRQLFEREGKTTEFDLLTKSLANLQRFWTEI
ncbi:Fe2+-dependent dioxygenase [Marinobacter adhaerens]|jgi:PKHD-type hydroxylase|uniref:Fe2+-dependent dioxygenase n=2 Tax=Marinobacter adhaerens TaxID=1033846 RepID=A0ABX8IHF7_9GAMM|nr:Fe2+-dependent dioxygenase [Marinobacter adhaerens]ADP99315.1 putative hydroxylase [Marinobacter adhaerens HP15]MBW4979272.1 Fe2+-dependent dioxygenase [Marinobacter adhaerens]QWV13242.1 Fe2+-dependent dioxygenase [Marinobacter adhaerens]